MENNSNINISNQPPRKEIDRNETPKKTNIFLSLPFYWILFTIIYSIMIYIRFFSSGESSIISYSIGAIGLFVPLGPSSLIYLFGAPLIWLGSLSLIILVIWSFNKIIKKWNINPIVNVLLIFIILFLLTIAVDYIFYGEWKSLDIFQHGGYIIF